MAAVTAVAVLAGGPDVPYPWTNRRLYERIRAGGVVLSELPPGQRAYRWAFPARNRIMAGLAAITVVVEAADPSGSLITSVFAADLGRTVAAVPGRITSRFSAGSNKLLVEGARIVTSRPGPAGRAPRRGLEGAGLAACRGPRPIQGNRAQCRPVGGACPRRTRGRPRDRWRVRAFRPSGKGGASIAGAPGEHRPAAPRRTGRLSAYGGAGSRGARDVRPLGPVVVPEAGARRSGVVPKAVAKRSAGAHFCRRTTVIHPRAQTSVAKGSAVVDFVRGDAAA